MNKQRLVPFNPIFINKIKGKNNENIKHWKKKYNVTCDFNDSNIILRGTEIEKVYKILVSQFKNYLADDPAKEDAKQHNFVPNFYYANMNKKIYHKSFLEFETREKIKSKNFKSKKTISKIKAKIESMDVIDDDYVKENWMEKNKACKLVSLRKQRLSKQSHFMRRRYSHKKPSRKFEF